MHQKLESLDKLSDRERQVFEMIGEGKTMKQIADRLILSPKTVETYRDQIRSKLGVKSSHELVVLAVTWNAKREV